MLTSRTRSFTALTLALLAFGVLAEAQPRVTSPKQHFGFNIGDDYHLANYQQTLAYWRALASESDRMTLVDIGTTEEGRPMVMAIITSPENHKKLDRYKEISRRLAMAEGLTDEQARALAAEGKAVVWIDGGLHATEVVGAQQLVEMVYQMVSRTDPETMRFLNDVIMLGVPANPDGMDLVSDWYMRDPDPKKRSMSGIPRLYQKYVGHDNNRDSYMVTQAETEAMSRILYHEWFPQIMYNHHQTGPAGTVLFAPPFRDPFNYYFDPLIPVGLDLVGAAMHNRFVAEDKPGATCRGGANYSTWWNGGLRTTVYFHNMIGLLTEIIGSPTPMEIPFVPQRQLPSGDLAYPITPQVWHLRQSIDYSVTANRAVIDVASKHREDFLYNIYQMGRNAIRKGSQDTWTVQPRWLARVQEAVAAESQRSPAGPGGRGSAAASQKHYQMLRDPALRDPRGFILPSDQSDFLTATKFVNTLIKTGVIVHRATAPFEVAGKTYPSGSYVVKAAQAFRPHVMSMFEPQDHPDDIPYPGGPPRPPYDSAGWTLAFQMGVEFDRILDGFDGPLERLEGFAKPPAGRIVRGKGSAAGYLLSHAVNDSFIATNRLLKAGEEVYWLKDQLSANGKTYPPGTIYIPAKGSTAAHLEKMASEIGLDFEAVGTRPRAETLKLRPVRIGLWDRYGGSMPSGWVRWLLEQFEFPFDVVYAPDLDAGRLSSKYDVLIFVGGAIPERDGAPGQGMGGGMPEPATIPEEWRNRLGNVSVATTVPQLKTFLEEGGTILAIGSSTAIGGHAGLPLSNHLVEKLQDGTERGLPREKYFVPGSILNARVDNTSPLAYGLNEQTDVFFSNSPVMKLGPDAQLKGVRPVAWFEGTQPLRSGWAWGQHYLEGGVAVAESRVGKGRLFLYGPEVTFRAQPHGTFKLVFNGIYYGPASAVPAAGKGTN
jgi:hypothetical protein